MGVVETVELDVYIHAQTPRAINVTLDRENSKGVWLPRSLIEIEFNPRKRDLAVITLPVWLAEREELV